MSEPMPIALPTDLVNRLRLYLSVQARVASVEEGGQFPERRPAYFEAAENLEPVARHLAGWLRKHHPAGWALSTMTPEAERITHVTAMWTPEEEFIAILGDDLGFDVLDLTGDDE